MAKEVNRDLDPISLKIIAELQQNARMTLVEIGKRVGLSAPAVAERIKKLEDEGYITGYKTVVDYDKLGLTVPVFINYKTVKLSTKEMFHMFNSMPEIIEWYSITGTHCALLKVVVESTKELDILLEYLQESGETTTSIILSSHSKSKTVDLNKVKL